MILNYNGREWAKCKEKPPGSDWSYTLECVSSYSLEFSVLLCFHDLSLLWDDLTVIDSTNQYPGR